MIGPALRSALAGVVIAATLLPFSARADETTMSGSVSRTNWDAAEPDLTSDAVVQHDFGQIYDVTLPRPAGQDATSYPNQIYAQPLVADGKLIVVTEENQVDALDPATGKLTWSVSLGPAWSPTPTCGDLVPHIGITSTPVYDPSTKLLYVVAKSADGTDAAHPNLRMHALAIADGSERTGWPVLLRGASTNGGEVLNMATANQRPGLLLLGGSVYFGTASHCDHGPYVGFVGGVTTTDTPKLTLWSSEQVGASSGAGIWQAGGGLMSDGPGRIFLATGNGVSPAPGPGTTPPGQLAESVVRLAVGSNGTLSTADFFSPANNAHLDQNDADLGSGAPVALPDAFGTAAHPHLLVIAGKDGVVRLLDRDDLGGAAQGSGGTDRVVSSLQLSGVWGHAAAFAAGSDHLIYLMPSNAPLQVLRVTPNASGVPTLSVVASSASSYGYTTGSPVVTSNGPNAATAVVWVVSCSGSAGTDARLNAFPAVPPAGGSWRPIASFALGTVAKFVQPATDGGRVYVGTRDGRVLSFGRPTDAALIGGATDFGLHPVGTPVTQDVEVEAQEDVTVTGVSTDAPFSVDPMTAVDLKKGDRLTVPVTFTPTSAATVDGVLRVQTGSGPGPSTTYRFSLSGTGTQDGVSATPSPVDFGAVHVGEAKQLGVTLRNTGTTDTTVTSVTPPGGPFAATAPPNGYVLPAQQSVTVAVQFTPTTTGGATGNLEVDTTTGSAMVSLSGTAESGSPAMTVPAALDFGNVAPGSRAEVGIVVANTGTTALTVTKAAPPAGPFRVDQPLAEGQRISPGDSLTVFVDVAPTSARPKTDYYSITGNDGAGARLVKLTVNTHPWIGQVVASLGCLDISGARQANGTAAVSYPCNHTLAQKFSNGAKNSLRMGAPTSRWCLDVTRAGTTAGTPLQLWGCNGSAAQAWTWDSTGRLVNPHARLCIDVLHHSPAKNTRLVLAACSTAPSQMWDASDLSGTRGRVGSGLAAAGVLCLTAAHGSSAPGTSVTNGVCGGPGQIVTLNGATLRVLGQCVAVADVHAVRGTGVWIEPCSGAATQQWQPGTYGKLTNPGSKLCLDVPGAVTTAGTPLQMWTCNNTVAQSWSLP